MTDLQQTLLEKANGSPRLHPDQQNKYLETYSERVIIEVPLEEVTDPEFLKALPLLLSQVQADFEPLFLKLAPQVPDQEQIKILKLAKEANIKATIVSSNCSHSPFGLILHTDHAVELDSRDAHQAYPNCFKVEKETEKTSFWKKLFH